MKIEDELQIQCWLDYMKCPHRLLRGRDGVHSVLSEDDVVRIQIVASRSMWFLFLMQLLTLRGADSIKKTQQGVDSRNLSLNNLNKSVRFSISQNNTTGKKGISSAECEVFHTASESETWKKRVRIPLFSWTTFVCRFLGKKKSSQASFHPSECCNAPRSRFFELDKQGCKASLPFLHVWRVFEGWITFWTDHDEGKETLVWNGEEKGTRSFVCLVFIRPSLW